MIFKTKFIYYNVEGSFLHYILRTVKQSSLTAHYIKLLLFNLDLQVC